jgi:RHS repeat-associated protein
MVYFTGTVTAGQTGQCSNIPTGNLIPSTPGVNFSYDSGVTNAIGRLVSVSSSAATNRITGYDSLGRVTGSSQTIGTSSPFPFSYTYNLAGALTSTTYPSGRSVATTYDPANRATSVTGTLNGTPTNYLTGITYQPHGGLKAHTYGNLLARTYGYNNRLQATEMKDTLPSVTNPLMDLQYYFGGSTTLNANSAANNGNLTQAVMGAQVGSTAMSFTQTYTYDSVNRLQSAGESTGWSEQFGYDQYGNMWLSPTGLFTQPLMPSTQSAYNPATNRLVGVLYDGAGNQLALGGAQTFTYDAESRQMSATNTTSGQVTSYVYDGLGERVMKSVGNVVTQYVYDAFGNLAAEYGGNGTQPPCTTCYLSFDTLGSTRMVTDGSGNVVARHDYLPFGSELPAGYGGRNAAWGTADATSQKYTGQERDAETGLDYFQARYMSSAQGRFMSADPSGDFVASTANPQSWNMFSYVLNNPFRFVDPSGRACVYSGSGDYGDPNNYEDDSSGGQDCATAFGSPATQVTTTDSFDSVPYFPFQWDFFGGLSNGGAPAGGAFTPPGSAPNNVPSSTACQVKIANALNSNLQPNTNVMFLGPTAIPPGQMDPRLGPGGRNGAYNFNYFAPGVNNPVAGSTNGSGRFPGSGLHVPLPGGADPVIPNFGPGIYIGQTGSFLTAHFDSGNPFDDLVSFFQHIINDVLRRNPHGC